MDRATDRRFKHVRRLGNLPRNWNSFGRLAVGWPKERERCLTKSGDMVEALGRNWFSGEQELQLYQQRAVNSPEQTRETRTQTQTQTESELENGGVCLVVGQTGKCLGRAGKRRLTLFLSSLEILKSPRFPHPKHPVLLRFTSVRMTNAGSGTKKSPNHLAA